MKRTLGIREFTRAGKSLSDYDYIDIEDQKTHTYRGLFVSKKYAADVKEFLDTKLSAEKHKKKETLNGFAGLASGDTGGRSFQKLKAGKKKGS